MCPTLDPVGAADFSETARPRPGHRKTGRRSGHDRVLAVFGGRLADDVAEGARERAQAVEPDVEADVGHAAVRFPQQVHRALDAATLQVAMRRLAKSRPE